MRQKAEPVGTSHQANDSRAASPNGAAGRDRRHDDTFASAFYPTDSLQALDAAMMLAAQVGQRPCSAAIRCQIPSSGI